TPKHNLATLTCVSKTVHIITTTLYILVDYTLFFSRQIGLSFGGKWALRDTPGLCAAQNRYANMRSHIKKAQFCEAAYLCYVGVKGLSVGIVLAP
ncbi:unnamed protein product, partial [Staurois parvus]